MELADALIALAHLEDAHAQLLQAVPHAGGGDYPLEDVSHFLHHALEPLRGHVNEGTALRVPRLRRRLIEFHDYLVLGRPDDEPARLHVDTAVMRIRQALELLHDVEPADSQR